MSEWFASQEYTLQTIAIYALLAYSVQIPMRAGVFSLAGVGFYAIGSYTAAIAVLHGQSTIIAIALAIGIGTSVGYALALLVVRLKGLYMAMATLSFVLLVGVTATNWTSLTGGAAGIYSIPVRISLTTMLATVALVGLALAFMERGVLGRMADAVREDEQLAQSLYIEPRQFQRFAFLLSAVIGSLAGAYHSLSAFSINAQDGDFETVVLILAMVILGGFTSWLGATLGVIILVWVPVQLSGLGSSWPLVYGTLLLLFAVYLPTGIYGAARDLVGYVISLSKGRLGSSRSDRRTLEGV